MTGSKKRPFFARVRGLWRRLRSAFPLTWLGAFALAGGLVALLRYGIGRIDLVLLVIGAVALGIIGLAVLFVIATALGVRRVVRRAPGGDPLRLECGYPSETGFSLSTLSLVPFVKVSWTWVTPTARVTVRRRGNRAYESITPIQRGVREDIVRRFEVADVFGISRIAFEAREARAVRFAPSVGALKSMHVVRSFSGGDDLPHPEGPAAGERMDMRHYNPGDPIKFVLWKIFARTRELVVRTPERALSPVRQTVAYMVSGEGDEPAAGAARVAIDSGALGVDWVLGADGSVEHAKSSQRALELLARSVETARDEQGAGLARFLSSATPGAGGRAVVFVPATPGPWLDRVVSAASARASLGTSPVEFVVCTDGIDRSPKRSLLRRIAVDDKRPVLEPPAMPGRAFQTSTARSEDLARVVESLSRARAKVLLVDRVAGRVYADGMGKP